MISVGGREPPTFSEVPGKAPTRHGNSFYGAVLMSCVAVEPVASEAKRQVKYSYIPIGSGKRSCIGGAMSQVENTLALALLLRRFTPVYVGQIPAPLNATVTLTPKGGLMFKVHEVSIPRQSRGL